MTDVKHEAAARPRPSWTPGDAQNIANADLFLVSDLATPTQLPGAIATRLTGLKIQSPAF